MAISFVRIDERVIHGQIITAWSKEFICDGIIIVDDAIASSEILTNVFKGAMPNTKIWVFTTKIASEKLDKVIASEKKYFLIAKMPSTLEKLLHLGISLNNDNQNVINVGPIHHKEGAKTVGANLALGAEDIKAFSSLSKKYPIEFKLIPSQKGYSWEDITTKL